jgi:hypothetical protein
LLIKTSRIPAKVKASNKAKATDLAAHSSKTNAPPIVAGKVLTIRALGLAVEMEMEVEVEAGRSQKTRKTRRIKASYAVY